MVEAVVLSCTNLSALDIVAQAELRSGKPLIRSNEALAWIWPDCRLCLRPMGV